LEGLPIAIDLDETARLVPLCDVYVACVSATVRWAIACGIPTVNYDAYRYGFEDYKGVVGVIGVTTKDEFVNTIRHVTTDPEFRRKLADQQRQVAADWACLDGKSGKRIIGLIEKTIRARHQR
jgi:hypothetical protein